MRRKLSKKGISVKTLFIDLLIFQYLSPVYGADIVFVTHRQVYHECLHRHLYQHLGPERRGAGLYQHEPDNQFLCCHLPVWQVSPTPYLLHSLHLKA